MKNKILKNIGTLVLGIGMGFSSYSQKTEKEVPCLSSEEVEFVVSEIPKHFKQIRWEDNYLIEFVPEAKNGYGLGGQLAVYFISGKDLSISIFDRTSLNPSEWYNVSNSDSKEKGCADWGVYLNIKSAKELSKTQRQKKFNEVVYKIKKIIK